MTHPNIPAGQQPGDQESEHSSPEHDRFYAAFEEHEKKTWHRPTLFDVWLMGRGLMDTNGRAINAASAASHQAAAAPQSTRQDEPKEVVGEPTALRAALRELVELKDLKNDLNSPDARWLVPLMNDEAKQQYEARCADYERRKPIAWTAARAALALQQEPKP